MVRYTWYKPDGSVSGISEYSADGKLLRTDYNADGTVLKVDTHN